MKVLKVLAAILIVFLLIITTTIGLTYQAMRHSLLSPEENVKALSDAKAQAETIDLFLENNDMTKELNLSDLISEDHLASFNSSELGDFVNSFVSNSLAYLFLESETVEPFDKTFISSFKDATISSALDVVMQDNSYQLLLQNIDKVDKSVAKNGLAEALTHAKLSYDDAELEGIVNSLYDGEPTKQKLKDELVTFIGNKVNIKFEPESAVERVLGTPRLVSHKFDYIFGKLLPIEIILLFLLLIVILMNSTGIFVSTLITLLCSVGALQLLRLFKLGTIGDNLPSKGLVPHYYGYMTERLTAVVNYISLAALATIVVLFIVNLIANKLSKKDPANPPKRQRGLRVVVSLIIVVVLVFVGYNISSETKAIQSALNDYNIEKEIENINDIFELKFDL